MKGWVTVWDDSENLGFLVQMRVENPGWVDLRVFCAVYITDCPKTTYYGSCTDDATPDLVRAPQFLCGEMKEDGGWYLRAEFCDNTKRNAAVEVDPFDLAKLFRIIAEKAPALAGGPS